MLQFLQIVILVSAVTFKVNSGISVQKCCPKDHFFSIRTIACKEKNLTWAPDLFEDDTSIEWSIPESVNSRENFNLDCSFNDVEPLFNIDKESYYFESGDLVKRSQPGVKYRDFCLEQTSKGRILALTCPCSKGGVCVNACCDENQLLDTRGVRAKCVEASNTSIQWRVDPLQQLFFIRTRSLPKCPPETEGMEILNVENNLKQYEFEVLANGTLYIHDHKMKDWKDPKDYCVGIFKQSNESTPSMNVVRCKVDQTPIRRRAAIYVTLFVIGAIFLVATLVVHTLLPSMRRSIRGLSLMAHCTCMLAAHIVLAVAQIIGATLTDVPCKIIAYLCQFTLLSGIFWMNVMCLDIGNTFSSLKSMARCLDSDYTAVLRTFLWYCLYAFGVPFILLVVTLGVDHSDLHHTNTFKPNIGLTACWFEKDSAAIITFFFGPIGLLLLINVILFVFVSCKITTEDSVLKNMPANTKRRQRKSVILFVKLSALMGLPWIMEIVSWAVGGEDHYWYFTDAINMLRSVFIFIVFCCKPKVWKMLKRNSKVSPSICWFSRRVGRENIMFPTSKDHQESTVSTNASATNDGENFQQMQERGDGNYDTQTNSGNPSCELETQEMQNFKSNQ